MSLFLLNKLRGRAAFRIGAFLAAAVYGALLVLDALPFVSHPLSSVQAQAFSLQLGFSALAALAFLIMGILVWRYSRERVIALTFLGFCLALMCLFLILPGASASIAPFTALSSCFTTAAFLFLLTLSLLFPHNALRSWWMRVYLFLIGILSLAMMVLFLLNWQRSTLANEFRLVASFYSVVLLSILAAIVFSYLRQDATLRKQQQLRLFTAGLMISISPLLFCTVLPEALHVPYSVNGQISGLAVCLLPLFLGYAIIRYQLFLRDTYIQHVALGFVRVVGVLCGGYLVFVLDVSLVRNGPGTVPIATIATALVSVGVWQTSAWLIEHLCFPEFRYYRQLIESRDVIGPSHGDRLLLELASTLTILFQTRHVQIYLLDEIAGCYRRQDVRQAAFESTQMIDGDHSLIASLQTNSPVLLGQERLTLADTVVFFPDEQKVLLVPLKGEFLIGFVVVGRRGDGGMYAGSDYEALAFLQQRFVPPLLALQVSRRKSRSAFVQGLLYKALSQQPQQQSMKAIAEHYAQAAVRALSPLTIDIWLPSLALPSPDFRPVHSPQRLFNRAVSAGGKSPFKEYFPARAVSWAACIYADHRGEQQAFLRSSLSFALDAVTDDSRFPVAWLPLQLGETVLGVLALTWPGPHLFHEEERQLLELVRSRLTTALQAVAIAQRLERADRELERLNRLKDGFIQTTCHELSTPLTIMEGYRELLQLSGLTSEQRDEYTQRANITSEELTVMLGTIMDIGRLNAEPIQVRPTHLLTHVRRVAEIFQVQAQQQPRPLHLDVPEVWVCADEMRLRQVLFNLFTNAFKYSAEGSPLECACTLHEEEVVISIRDYGLGIPPEEQPHLFERFYRLERDRNSPVRGVGLGLSICKQIVEAMGGTIWVESSGIEGEGSTVAFTLLCAITPCP